MLMGAAGGATARDAVPRYLSADAPAAGDALAVFLRAEARRPFDWSAANCLLMPSDWAVALGLPDPAGPWRTACVDDVSAQALAAGGVLPLAREAMERIGARPTTHAVRGDVGVVTVIGPDGPALAGAICTGSRWALRAARGLWIGRAVAAAAWRLNGEG